MNKQKTPYDEPRGEAIVWLIAFVIVAGFFIGRLIGRLIAEY